MKTSKTLKELHPKMPNKFLPMLSSGVTFMRILKESFSETKKFISKKCNEHNCIKKTEGRFSLPSLTFLSMILLSYIILKNLFFIKIHCIRNWLKFLKSKESLRSLFYFFVIFILIIFFILISLFLLFVRFLRCILFLSFFFLIIFFFFFFCLFGFLLNFSFIVSFEFGKLWSLTK